MCRKAQVRAAPLQYIHGGAHNAVCALLFRHPAQESGFSSDGETFVTPDANGYSIYNVDEPGWMKYPARYNNGTAAIPLLMKQHFDNECSPTLSAR